LLEEIAEVTEEAEQKQSGTTESLTYKAGVAISGGFSAGNKAKTSGDDYSARDSGRLLTGPDGE